MQCFETDIVVVGCGVAGMAAALTAAENDARVICVERATFEERGGNSRWTDANMMLKTGQKEFELSDPFWDGYGANNGFHVNPAFVRETANNNYVSWHPLVKTAPFLDPELLGVFARETPPTLEWLKDCGVSIDLEGKFYPWFIRVFLSAFINGGGLEVIEKLTPLIQARGGRFLCETTATDLVVDENGAVCGLRATGKQNRPVEIRAHAVVLACGGFQGNPQMLAQYLGPRSRFLRPVAEGGYYNKGEGLRMALALNAAPAGDWSDMHLQQVDPRSNRPEALVDIWSCGIVVNRQGRRFMDECPDDPGLWQEEPGKAVLAQEDGIGYIIYDDQLHSAPDQTWRLGVRSEVSPYRAETLEQLADQLDIPPANLLRTVRQFNRACIESEAVDYGNFDAKSFSFGKHRTRGIDPPKSNYAKRIEKPPYFCYPMISAICFTYGGLRVTPDAEVINCSGETIPGLYAAGETVGMHYRKYTGATSVLRGLTFGRIAGRHAAKRLSVDG